ncbi:MAG: response regulator transcription factor [Rhizobiaceae bacterium]
MIVIIEERDLVKTGYTSQFNNEGFPTVGFDSEEFDGWIGSASEQDLTAVGACLIGENQIGGISPDVIRKKTNAPVIALVDQSTLEKTLRCFEQGMDDVVRKPVHAKEILARIAAIKRRNPVQESYVHVGELNIHLDGRDPEISGTTFPLPRRERRILEYLASIDGRRATKAQIFNSIYGVFNENIEENVIESHISKLRKKLRQVLGFDPIDSKRFLGYRLIQHGELPEVKKAKADTSFSIA